MMRTPSYRGVKNRIAYDRGELLSNVVASENVTARLAERYLGVVGALNRWVDDVRRAEDESIPYFDPWAASVAARVLLLLQDPSGAADGESGFISLHNNDQTAHNVYKLFLESGLDYSVCLPWNVIPWWVANPAKGKRSLKSEARRARPYLDEFLDRLPEKPAAVLIMGKSETWPAWEAAVGNGLPTRLADAEILFTAHPGPLSINQSDNQGGTNRDGILAAFHRAAAVSA